MNTGARLGPIFPTVGMRGPISGSRPVTDNQPKNSEETHARDGDDVKLRVFIAAENRLLREALARMLARRGGFDVLGVDGNAPNETKDWAILVSSSRIGTLVLNSTGSQEHDFGALRQVRSATPKVRILVLGLTGSDSEFLGYVRAGIDGCLLRDATAEDVLEAVRAVHAGDTVCPGLLCSVLFRYMERETTAFPSVGMNRELGLTRRETQLIPLIARGLTNKEIANHFCLSEQTVKNHLYRMKQKIGAYDRFGIVQRCQQQGFLL